MNDDPYAKFSESYRRAVASEAFDASRCAFATAGANAVPTVRFVLVKDFDPEAFAIYTNYGSPKSRQATENPVGALAWHWHSLGMQVRIEGPLSRAPAERSDRYFRSRSRGSQLGAWASAQSEVVESRELLAQAVAEVANRFEGQEVPRPPGWGGYLLRPERYEFWYDGADRLHDRFSYRRDGATWHMDRLQP
jgi:pyridoxamine 5'-phosphate oxidase